MVGIVVGLCLSLVFLFVPETFWDRLPRPGKHGDHPRASRPHFRHQHGKSSLEIPNRSVEDTTVGSDTIHPHQLPLSQESNSSPRLQHEHDGGCETGKPKTIIPLQEGDDEASRVEGRLRIQDDRDEDEKRQDIPSQTHVNYANTETPEIDEKVPKPSKHKEARHYTGRLRQLPPKTYMQTLKPWNGKLRNENWLLVALRPFLLFAYPAILWSTLIYSLSIGWLIVLSEAVSEIYKSEDTYHFTSLQAGLVYVSPFIGGILGTAVAGKFSDIIVRYMARRNDGVYEPEFRLVMAIPIAISTCIGLMGFGWSADERDNWIVPTVFFGVISFGCSLGSTTSITFAVDSYRQYAGEALVTLNFSKSKYSGGPNMCEEADVLSRHLSWPSFLFVFQQVARIRRTQTYFRRHWGHSVGLSIDDYPHVYLR